MARKKKTDAAATTAADASAAEAAEIEKKAFAAVSLMAPKEAQTTTRGGGGTDGKGTVVREDKAGEKESVPEVEVLASGDRQTTQQQAPGQTAEGGCRADMQLLSASQRKNLKKKLRKQEQRQQEAAVLAAVRGDDAAVAFLYSGVGEDEGGEQTHVERAGISGKATVGRGVAAIYAEQEQALRKRLEALKTRRSTTSSSSRGQLASNNATAGGGGRRDAGRRMAATAGDIEALILDVDAILEQEEALLRKPLRKRVGVEQLQQQVREIEQQIQKSHKEVQRKTAAAAAAQQSLQQKGNTRGSSTSHAAATATAKAEELEAERARLEESLRYVSHLREQLVLTQQQQEFRSFHERMQTFKAECVAALRTLSHPTGGKNGGGGTGGGLGYRGSGGGNIGAEVGNGSVAGGGGGSTNGVTATAGYYSSAKEAQWRRRLQEWLHLADRGVDPSSTSSGQASLNYTKINSNSAAVTSAPRNGRRVSIKGNAAAKIAPAEEEEGEEEPDNSRDRRQDSAGGGSSAAAAASLLLQTVNIGADAMSLLFPGGAVGGNSNKLPLVRKIERAHQVVLEKQQGGGGRAGVVLIVGLEKAAIRQCAATLAALDESMQTDNRSKYRIEAAEGCSIGSIIGVRGGNLRKLEEECGVVVWAEGTEFIVIAPTNSAIQKGLQRLRDLMASSQNLAGGDNTHNGAGGGSGGGASVTITLSVPVARACVTPAMRTKIREIEAQTNCTIRVLRRGIDGAVLVSAGDAAAAAAGGKALQDAAAQLDIRSIPAEAEKVIRLLKNQSNLAFNVAARERSGIACLRGEDGLLLVGPIEGGALDEAQQGAEEALQQLSRVTDNVVLTQNQLRVLTRAERTAIEEKTGVYFRMPRVGGGTSSGAAAPGGQGGGKGAAAAGGSTAGGSPAAGSGATGEKGKVVISLVGRAEEVKRARELVEQVLRDRGYQEVVEACRELTTALLADRGAGVRKLEEKYEVSVSIEKQEKRVTIRGAQERVQDCAAEVRERHLQLQQSSNSGIDGGGGAAYSAAAGSLNSVDGGSGNEEGGGNNGTADVVVQRVPIRKSQVAAFIGKRGTHVRGIQAASGVDSIRVEETEGMVIIRGAPHAVAKGVQLVTESLAGTGAAAGVHSDQQQQEKGKETNGETFSDESSKGGGGNRPPSGAQQQQLNGDASSGSGGRNNAQYSRGRRGGGRGRQVDQGPQHDKQEEYSNSGGKGSNNSSYFNRTGGGRGARGGRRGGGGGFAYGGVHNSRHHEQQQQQRSPVSMDASDETAFPSLEDATGAAMFAKKYTGRGAGSSGTGPAGAQQQQGTASSKQVSTEASGRNSSSAGSEDLNAAPTTFDEGKSCDREEINLRENCRGITGAIVQRGSQDEEAEDTQRNVMKDCGRVQQHEEEEEYEQHDVGEDQLYCQNVPGERQNDMVDEERYPAESGSTADLLFNNSSSEVPTTAAHLNGNCCDPPLLCEKDVTIEKTACPVAAAAQRHCVPCTNSVPEEEVF